MFKENTAYIILALVAIVLIGITIGLQIVILSDQPSTAGVEETVVPNVSSDSFSGQIQSGGTGSSANSQGGDQGTLAEQVAMALLTPTDTPVVIVLEPTSLPATATPPPTDTAVPPTPTIAAPTSTPLPPTVEPEAAEPEAGATEGSASESAAEAPQTSTVDGDGSAGAVESQPASEPRSVAQALVDPPSNSASNSGAGDSAQGPLPKETVMSATNVTTSDDNRILAELVETEPYAISFVPYAFYVEMAQNLRAVGLRSSNDVVVEPTLDSLSNGQYPLARPLYIYATADTIQSRPELRAFLSCYLNRVSEEVTNVGYFRLSSSRFQETLTTFGLATGDGGSAVPSCNPNIQATSPIEILGSSTVAPLTSRIAEIVQEEGFAGDIQVIESGTGRGFELFCQEGRGDIVNASRAIKESELAACRAIGREPIALTVGADAIAIVVHPDNTFVDALSYDELWQAFSDALLWSDIDPTWPDEQIVRAVRRRNSGTLDFFVEQIFEGDFEALAAANPPQQAEPEEQPQPAPVPDAPTPTPAVVAETPPTNSADIVFGVVERGHNCSLMTGVVASLVEDEFGLTTDVVEVNSAQALYEEIATKDVDVTLCHIDPDDRSYITGWLGHIRQIGTSHWAEGNYKILIWAKASTKANYRSNQRCLLDLLEKVSFEPASLVGDNATAWISENRDEVDEWLACPYSE